MKNVLPLMALLFLGLHGFAQSINPSETFEICPHTNYLNATNTDARTIRFEINFGDGQSAADYSIITNTTDASKPVACKVVTNLSVSTFDSRIGVCYIAFQDQHASTPSFTTLKTGTTTKKTFKFPYLRTLQTIVPAIIPPGTVNYQICTISQFSYNLTRPVRYRKTDDHTEFGVNISDYEYSVPKGWKVGSQTSTGPTNYIHDVPNAIITTDAFHSGEVKIRASQRGGICDGTTTPASGEWFTIPLARLPLTLTSDSGSSVTLNCGVSAAVTFTVTNGPSGSCATYEWNLGGANNNWLYNGSPAPQPLITTSNSITLTTNTCGGKPGNVFVTLRGSNSEFVTSTIPVTMNVSPLTISGEPSVCTTRDYTIPGLPCNSQVTWTSSDPSIATISGTGDHATVTKVIDGVVTISAAITGGCNGGTTLTKVLEVGPPTSWYDLITDLECFQRRRVIPVRAVLSQGVQNTQFEWGYRVFDPNASDVVLGATADHTTFYFTNSGIYGIYAKPKNACGAGIKSTRGLFVVDNCSMLNVLSTSPNPVTSEMTVTVDEKHAYLQSEKSSKIEFYLYRFSDGQLAKHWSLSGNQSQYRLRLQGVQKGTYVLTVIKGTKKLTKQIIVE